MTPIIYDRDESGLRPAGGDVKPYLFGGLGNIESITVHHTAGPRAETKAEAKALNHRYQAEHIAKGWGDFGYHATMDDLGRFYRGRPADAKGTHTALHNSRNFGISVHGNYDVMGLTDAQYESLRWLFRGGFVVLSGEPESGIRFVLGHQEWPDNATACPGKALMRHVAYLRRVETF